MASSPAQVLNLGPGPNQNHFNVGVGRPTGHVDYDMKQLVAGLVVDPGFKVVENGVEFSARADAKTTSKKTKYGRSELRELNADGSKAAWDGRKGYHRLSWTARVMKAPDGRSRICFGQIHDSRSDLVRLQTEGTNGSVKLVARNTPPGSDTETVKTIRSSYRLGDPIVCDLDVANGKGTVYLDGVAVHMFPAAIAGCYAKTGCYNQFNASQVPASETGVVAILDLVCRHSSSPLPPVRQGGPVPTPSPPPTPTPQPVPPGTRVVMILRHGERPDDPNSHVLSVRGQERASKLAWLFTRPDLVERGLHRPERLAASKGNTSSMRMVQTLTPLAGPKALNLPIDTRFDWENAQKDVAAWLRAQTGVTLACGEHSALVEVGKGFTLNSGKLPGTWPGDRFDVIWVFTSTDGGKTWAFRQIPEMLLLPGDKNTGI